MISEVPKIVKTIREAAPLLGVSETTVRIWMAEGCPGGPGDYNIDTMKQWRLVNKHPKRNTQNINSSLGELASGNGDGAPLHVRRAEADIARLTQDAISKQLRNERMTGELIGRKEVEQQLSEAIVRIKTRLEAVPDEMQIQVPPELRKEVRQSWNERIALVLNELMNTEIEGLGSVEEMILNCADEINERRGVYDSQS